MFGIHNIQQIPTNQQKDNHSTNRVVEYGFLFCRKCDIHDQQTL